MPDEARLLHNELQSEMGAGIILGIAATSLPGQSGQSSTAAMRTAQKLAVQFHNGAHLYVRSLQFVTASRTSRMRAAMDGASGQSASAAGNQSGAQSTGQLGGESSRTVLRPTPSAHENSQNTHAEGSVRPKYVKLSMKIFVCIYICICHMSMSMFLSLSMSICICICICICIRVSVFMGADPILGTPCNVLVLRKYKWSGLRFKTAALR